MQHLLMTCIVATLAQATVISYNTYRNGSSLSNLLTPLPTLQSILHRAAIVILLKTVRLCYTMTKISPWFSSVLKVKVKFSTMTYKALFNLTTH